MRSHCVKLTWQANEMVSCLHAAEAWLRSPANMDAALAGALTAPATASRRNRRAFLPSVP